MDRRPTTAVTSAVNLLLLLIIITRAMADGTHSHNITTILAEHPQFSTFNLYLTTTGLAEVINNLTDVTVCSLNNSAMSDLLSLHPTPTSLRRILLFHLFSHYSDADSLNSCCAWTLYPRPSGAGNEVVDQADIGDGKISFTHPFAADYSQLLGTIQQIPPHLSVLHVSTALPSPELRSLTSPVETLKHMTSAGCGAFAGAVAEAAAAERLFRENAYVGMTVVCPVDAAWERFIPRFREMKEEEEKVELLLFHAIPVYHRKCEMRGRDMSEWRPATLTSYYRGNGGFGEPTVNMAVVGKLIVGFGLDEGGPLAIYPIKGVLSPDDPIGVVEYLDPTAPAERAELATEEECWFPRFLAPAPELSMAADSGLVEDVNTDSAKLV